MLEFRLNRLDWRLLGAVLTLTAIGMVMIYSATRAHLTVSGAMPTKKLLLQAVWVLCGLILFTLVSSFDYSRLQQFAWPIYLSTLGLCVLVLVIGGLVRETQRWISIGPVNIQPAELAKLGVILMLATFFAQREGEAVEFELLSRALAYAAVPCALILLQPDLGTPVLIIFVWGIVCYMVGARLHHLGAFFFAFIMLFVAAWGFNLIKPHQKVRLTAFISDSADAQKERWQVDQSIIAIGSGHIFGQGLFRGSQSQLSFVPDQETDFIFSVIGEELGFAGSVTVIFMLGVLLWRTLMICANAKNLFGRLLAAGIVAMFFLHILANVGMTLGVTPVKGMPLPFVSYGGSSMLVNFIALGVLQSIYADRQTIRFE